VHQRVFCRECDWHGDLEEVDHVYDPKPRPGIAADCWQVCPQCRTPEHIGVVCDESGCEQEATCGTPTPSGYRQVCGFHYRQLTE